MRKLESLLLLYVLVEIYQKNHDNNVQSVIRLEITLQCKKRSRKLSALSSSKIDKYEYFKKRET